ncbi:MBL fold metallo-hydrolase [Streptomyces sp. KL116D]|uniref:MBL fold metallo-hydrolase n=1 Tax=Streptomyces sp. KL116D TaxID=3045152 RepID=UPI0035592422
MAELGRSPEQIEAVAFSHLHPDHLGWAVHPVPGTGARALRARRPPGGRTGMGPVRAAGDRRHARRGHRRARAPRPHDDRRAVHLPRRAGPITAGHTEGHAEFVITGGGRRLIAFGDSCIHRSRPTTPEWSCVYDHDPARSAGHRHRLVAELEEPDTIGFGIHFADVVFGHVRRDGKAPPGAPWRPRTPGTTSHGDDRIPRPRACGEP